MDVETQTNRVVNFINQQLDKLGVALIAIKPVAADNRLTVDIQFIANYAQFFEFFNALSASKTLLMVDELTVSTGAANNKLMVNLRLLSAYR